MSFDDSKNTSLKMEQPSTPAPQTGNKSGTDFVKKLFQMLEENSYSKIVRWSDAGDSFIITDTNEFTKDVLPSYFKHSNFASFVRQLNKYDFHKVKISNELKQRYQIENVWEFKHPDFNKHNKQSLDNIKRKVPVKKDGDSNQSNQNCVSINQFRNLQDRHDYLEKENSSLNKTVTKLHDDISNLTSKYNSMVSSLLTQRTINESYSRSIDTLAKCIVQIGVEVPPLDLPFLSSPVTPLPPSQPIRDPTSLSSLVNATTTPSQFMTSHSPLNQANGPAVVSPNTTGPQHLHSTSNSQHTLPVVVQSAPQPSASLSSISSTSQPQQTQAQPQQPQISGHTLTPAQREQRLLARPTGSALHVLLVEDDQVCIQLCRKFLMKYGCSVEVVTDGLAAIKVVEKVKFDLVLMDIVMPNLDGASATSIIRSFDKDTPIIAMTGNYQRQDLVTYLNHGMTDILAKPFTKDDLYMILEKHQINKKLIHPSSESSLSGPSGAPGNDGGNTSTSGTPSSATNTTATGNTGSAPPAVGTPLINDDPLKGIEDFSSTGPNTKRQRFI